MSREHKPSRRAARVWRRMTQWYGARLAESYGPLCPEDWCEVIDRTDDERLEQALATVRRDHLHHPPTLGEFEAAIPEKRKLEGPSIPVLLVRYAVSRFSLCQHQLMQPWHHFGPEQEFTSKSRGGEVLKHPDIAGLVVPSCKACGNPSHRVKVEDLAGSAAA